MDITCQDQYHFLEIIFWKGCHGKKYGISVWLKFQGLILHYFNKFVIKYIASFVIFALALDNQILGNMIVHFLENRIQYRSWHSKVYHLHQVFYSHPHHFQLRLCFAHLPSVGCMGGSQGQGWELKYITNINTL